MTLYFFLRYMVVLILLVGWLFFQLVVKKKKVGDLKNDAMAIAFFVLVWMGLSYLLLH